MKEQIKELRVRVDGLAQLTKELKPCKISYGVDPTYKLGNSKEIEKTVDSLYLAKAWLGKVLGELGESTPYANDGNRKTVDDIEPTADTLNRFKVKSIGFNENVDSTYIYYNLSKENWDMFNYIEKVDWLRQEIQHLTHLVYQYCVENSKTRFHSEIAYRHLCEARFWLGFELERIRESSTHNI